MRLNKVRSFSEIINATFTYYRNFGTVLIRSIFITGLPFFIIVGLLTYANNNPNIASFKSNSFTSNPEHIKYYLAIIQAFSAAIVIAVVMVHLHFYHIRKEQIGEKQLLKNVLYFMPQALIFTTVFLVFYYILGYLLPVGGLDPLQGVGIIILKSVFWIFLSLPFCYWMIGTLVEGRSVGNGFEIGFRLMFSRFSQTWFALASLMVVLYTCIYGIHMYVKGQREMKTIFASDIQEMRYQVVFMEVIFYSVLMLGLAGVIIYLTLQYFNLQERKFGFGIKKEIDAL